LKHAADQLIGLQHLNLLMIRFYQETFAYWAGEEDPQQWFLKEAGEFKPDVESGCAV
jgi:hypothetical protein